MPNCQIAKLPNCQIAKLPSLGSAHEHLVQRNSQCSKKILTNFNGNTSLCTEHAQQYNNYVSQAGAGDINRIGFPTQEFLKNSKPLSDINRLQNLISFFRPSHSSNLNIQNNQPPKITLTEEGKAFRLALFKYDNQHIEKAVLEDNRLSDGIKKAFLLNFDSGIINNYFKKYGEINNDNSLAPEILK